MFFARAIGVQNARVVSVSGQMRPGLRNRKITTVQLKTPLALLRETFNFMSLVTTYSASARNVYKSRQVHVLKRGNPIALDRQNRTPAALWNFLLRRR